MIENYNKKETVENYDKDELEGVTGQLGSEFDEKVETKLSELENGNIRHEDSAETPVQIIESEDTEAELPTLYSPRVIYVFSALFSLFFGFVLFSINLKEVNKKRGILPTILFTISYFALTWYISMNIKLGSSGGIIFGIIYASIINTLFWNNYIGKEKEFKKKSYKKPLIIALIIFIPLIVLILWATTATNPPMPR